MSRKRRRLNEETQPETPAEAAPEAAEPVLSSSKPKAAIGSRGRVALTVYLSLEAYDQLKDLARVKRAKGTELLRDGLNRVFEENGLPPIA